MLLYNVIIITLLMILIQYYSFMLCKLIKDQIKCLTQQISMEKFAQRQKRYLQNQQWVLQNITQKYQRMSKLNINDLLTSLAKPASISKKGSQNSQALPIPKFVESVVNDKNKKINVMSRKQEEMMRRQSNYEMAKEQMDKWVGIIKVNRQKESLNFTQKDIGNLNVNFFPAQPINQFHKKLQSKLQAMHVQNQKAVLKHEQAVLEKVDPQQAKRRLIQARKHRTAVFYEQQKRRRISKIKSKLYHKIKKRQKQRDEIKNIQKMNPAEKNNYIQKLTKQRIKERITLRHNTKNKHIQNLLRFNRNEKNSIQNSINQINDIRHKKMERLNQGMMDQVSEEYDDDNFREQAIKDLEAEIEAIEKEEGGQEQMEDEVDEKLKDLKFIKNAKQRKNKKQKQDAYKILNKLSKGKELKQKDVNSDIQQSNEVQEQSEEQSQEKNRTQRKKYGIKITEHAEEQMKKAQSEDMQKRLQNYLLSGNTHQDKVQKEKKNQLLIKDINLDNLKSKYQSDRVPIDLSSLIEQNQDIYHHQNQAVLENVREFQSEKIAQIQQLVDKKQGEGKGIKGWGSWAGPGISEKKIDPQQQLRKKLKAIEEIKQKRKDNSLANITISQSRNKKLSEYMVRDLPRNFANADQFDFMQSEAVGPQWNSFTQFNDNIKPKVIAKAGQVIKPVTMPKSMGGKKKQ